MLSELYFTAASLKSEGSVSGFYWCAGLCSGIDPCAADADRSDETRLAFERAQQVTSILPRLSSLLAYQTLPVRASCAACTWRFY